MDQLIYDIDFAAATFFASFCSLRDTEGAGLSSALQHYEGGAVEAIKAKLEDNVRNTLLFEFPAHGDATHSLREQLSVAERGWRWAVHGPSGGNQRVLAHA